jgi:hypothetical protein
MHDTLSCHGAQVSPLVGGSGGLRHAAAQRQPGDAAGALVIEDYQEEAGAYFLLPLGVACIGSPIASCTCTGWYQAHGALLQVRKALDMIRKIADAQTAAEAEEKDEDGEKKGALLNVAPCLAR